MDRVLVQPRARPIIASATPIRSLCIVIFLLFRVGYRFVERHAFGNRHRLAYGSAVATRRTGRVYCDERRVRGDKVEIERELADLSTEGVLAVQRFVSQRSNLVTSPNAGNAPSWHFSALNFH